MHSDRGRLGIFGVEKNIMGLLNKLFGNKVDFGELIARGAPIIDVRTPGEYRSGHVKGSKNIPLDQLAGKMKQLKKAEGPVILCCASGARSGRATRMLKAEGIEAYNGGSWVGLRRYV